MTNTDKEVKLENCPFCGGKARHGYEMQIDDSVYDYVECMACSVRNIDSDADSIVEAWNSRAPTAREKKLEAEIMNIKNMLNNMRKLGYSDTTILADIEFALSI